MIVTRARRLGPWVVGCLLATVLAGCGTTLVVPEGAEGLETFLKELAGDLEAHRWQRILTRADPEHYRTQVTSMGMGEPQYVSELLGLHEVGNDIGQGSVVGWADLERIRKVAFVRADRRGELLVVVGSARLRDRSTLSLQVELRRDGEGYLLTGAVG